MVPFLHAESILPWVKGRCFCSGLKPWHQAGTMTHTSFTDIGPIESCPCPGSIGSLGAVNNSSEVLQPSSSHGKIIWLYKMKHTHIYIYTYIIIKGSWEAILPCYGQIEFCDLTWCRVVDHITIHNITIHNKRIRSSGIDFDEGWW